MLPMVKESQSWRGNRAFQTVPVLAIYILDQARSPAHSFSNTPVHIQEKSPTFKKTLY